MAGGVSDIGHLASVTSTTFEGTLMKLSNMANVLRAAGLTVVETPGWANRGYANQDLQAVRGVLWHHTATHRSRFVSSDAPTLSMCLNGRPDLPGPLCQIVFGRNGTVYLLAAGVANHAGMGSAPGIPVNAGNHYLIGIEMESSGIAPWDWTADQIRVAPILGAALERAYLSGLPEDQRLQLAHYEYSSQGKIDPAGWPGGMDGLRSSINAVLRGVSEITKGEEVIEISAQQAEAIAARAAHLVLHGHVDWFGFNGVQPKEGRRTTTLALQAGWADTQVAALAGELAALKSIVEQLSVKQGVTIDYELIAKAVNEDAAKRLAK